MIEWLTSVIAGVSDLGPIPTFFGAIALVTSGVPVLFVAMTFCSLLGLAGLVISLLAIYSSVPVLYFLASRFERFKPRFLILDHISPEWLFLSVAIVPFWPFVASCGIAKVPLGRVLLAIFCVSTPTAVVFSSAVLLGSDLHIPAFWMTFLAALVVSAISYSLRFVLRRLYADVPSSPRL